MIEQFQDGILIYEPWYSRLMAPLEVLEQYLDLPATVSIGGVALSDILGEIIFHLAELGLNITVSVFGVAWLLAMKAAGRIYRGVRERAEVTAAVSATVEANVL